MNPLYSLLINQWWYFT